jgi:hypothetical protein
MAGELLRPGVEVIQTFRSASPSFARPALVPCVVGPAFEVINVLTTEGTINSKAKWGGYSQIGKVITQSAFPDPRSNNDELNFLEETIRPFMLTGGNLTELPMGPGEGFLATSHGAARAALRSVAFGGSSATKALGGKVLVLAIDQPARLDTSADITITFEGTNLTAAQVAAQINTAVGASVASVVGGSSDIVQIASLAYGAMSSVTVRPGGTANSLLELGFDSATQREERVEGAGWRGQDDSDNDTTTPWIEFYQGDFLVNGSSTAFSSKAGLIDVEQGTYGSAKQPAVLFGDAAGRIPLKVGDFVFADGLRVKSGEVMKVEEARFKVGTINTALSVADSAGRYTSKVYDGAEVATLFDANPFAPKYVYFKANGLDEDEVAPTAMTLLGSVTGTASEQAVVTGTDPGPGPFNLAGLTLHYVVTIDGVEVEGTFTFTGSYADMAAVVAALGSNIPGVTPTGVVVGTDPSLRLTTVKYGKLQAVKVKKDGTANSSLGYNDSADTSDTGKDVEFSGLTGQQLQFKLDQNPHLYAVTAISDSLDDFITEVNSAVGASVASKGGGTSRQILLTSTLKGLASKVEVLDAGNAAATLGLDSAGSPTATAGTGRPYPDAYLDDSNNLVINSQLLRDQVTGYPLDFATNSGTLYIQFKALRKDVSAVAKVAGVLRIPDPDTLAAVLDPLTEDNPLGLGLFLCQLNAPGLEIKGLGVDEVTGAAPEGTPLAYARAASMLESEEVYALAPLTHDEVIHGLWMTHVVAMSEPEQAGERIVFFNKKMPVRKNAKIAASGTQANSTATTNQMLLDVNPASGLVGLGLNPADPLTVENGVYMEFVVAGQLRRYSVSTITGSLANFRVAFAAGENDDGFYSDVALTESVVNASWSLKVRGVSIMIPGSNPPRLDYSLVAETVGEANATFKNRRSFSVFPDQIKTSVNGIEKSLPGYYGCAAITGMVASQPPQQGFTNFPITGLTGVVGTEKFSKKQLNVMAGGGTYILIQDVQGGAVTCRHQLSTDLTSIETRELSITKVVDFTAKFLRLGVRKFIGVQVINEALLDTIGTTVQGMLSFLTEAGVLNGANLNNIVQDTSQPDTILVDVTLDVPYPCNYIRLTLVV